MDLWLRRQLLESHTAGRCVRIQLMHLGGRHRGIRNWEIPEQTGEEFLEQVGDEILDAAQADANDMFGRQRYSLCAFYERSPDQIGESKTFTRDGGGENDDAAEVDSEPATARGLQAQLMRHNEANGRTLVLATQTLAKASGRQIDRLTERLGRMEDAHLRVLQLMESLVTERHEREIKTKEHELRTKMWGEGFDKAALLFPVIVNKLAGQRILPEPASAQGELIGNFLESITKEQVEKLQAVLRPDQFLVVMEMYAERQRELDKRKREQESRQPGTNGTTPQETTTP